MALRGLHFGQTAIQLPPMLAWAPIVRTPNGFSSQPVVMPERAIDIVMLGSRLRTYKIVGMISALCLTASKGERG